jgi:hypothetical protein
MAVVQVIQLLDSICLPREMVESSDALPGQRVKTSLEAAPIGEAVKVRNQRIVFLLVRTRSVSQSAFFNKSGGAVMVLTTRSATRYLSRQNVRDVLREKE